MYLNLEEDTCATSDVNEQLQLRSASVGVSTTLTAADLGGPEAGIATMHFFCVLFLGYRRTVHPPKMHFHVCPGLPIDIEPLTQQCQRPMQVSKAANMANGISDHDETYQDYFLKQQAVLIDTDTVCKLPEMV